MNISEIIEDLSHPTTVIAAEEIARLEFLGWVLDLPSEADVSAAARQALRELSRQPDDPQQEALLYFKSMLMEVSSTHPGSAGLVH